MNGGIATLGDGDGYFDIVLGAHNEDTAGSSAGAVYVVLGPTKGEVALADADAKFTGERSGDYAGWALSSGGDVDGDGLSDIVVGAPNESTGASGAGAVYLLSGRMGGTMSLSYATAKLTGITASDSAGISVSSEGDVNADGYADMVVGAPDEDTAGSEAGAVYLVLGPAVGTMSLGSADAVFTGEAASDNAGYHVSSRGDTNADTHADILIGAYMESTTGTYSGAAYLLLGG